MFGTLQTAALANKMLSDTSRTRIGINKLHMHFCVINVTVVRGKGTFNGPNVPGMEGNKSRNATLNDELPMIASGV